MGKKKRTVKFFHQMVPWDVFTYEGVTYQKIDNDRALRLDIDQEQRMHPGLRGNMVEHPQAGV